MRVCGFISAMSHRQIIGFCSDVDGMRWFVIPKIEKLRIICINLRSQQDALASNYIFDIQSIIVPRFLLPVMKIISKRFYVLIKVYCTLVKFWRQIEIQIASPVVLSLLPRVFIYLLDKQSCRTRILRQGLSTSSFLNHLKSIKDGNYFSRLMKTIYFAKKFGDLNRD